jgi:hypothetical protein
MTMGVAVLLIGVLLAARPVNDILQEGQGHCDYLPCVSAMTIPVLVLATGIALLGMVVLRLATRGKAKR